MAQWALTEPRPCSINSAFGALSLGLSIMKIIFACSAALAVLLISPSAFAQSTATATATGSTTIVRPIAITKNVDLSFGRIVRPASGTGTVTIANSADVVSAGSGAVALSGVTTTRAKFTLDGEGGQAVSISIPTSFDMALSSDATKKIIVTLSPDLASSIALSNALGSSGTQALYVGGNFSLPASQANGAYTGTFDVTVAYQ